MTFKFIPFFTLMALAAAGHQHYAVPHQYEHEPVGTAYHGHEAPIQYDFSYSVHDDHTKDIKSRMESRKDDMVKGHYDMIDSDGYKRIVDYTADDKNGFLAMVHREKTDIHVPTPTVNYHQGQYYHSEYPQHSLEHHHMALPVHSADENKQYHHAVYADHSVHSAEDNKPNHYAVYADHSVQQHNIGLPEHSGEESKPYHHTVYADHSIKQHHMGQVHSGEENKPYHHAIYAEHSLEHHHMALPTHSAEPHKPILSYLPKKQPVHFVPVAKHFSHVEHIAPKYIAPVEHKDVASISHSEVKATPDTHSHAKTHVSFHGVNAKYEY